MTRNPAGRPEAVLQGCRCNLQKPCSEARKGLNFNARLELKCVLCSSVLPGHAKRLHLGSGVLSVPRIKLVLLYFLDKYKHKNKQTNKQKTTRINLKNGINQPGIGSTRADQISAKTKNIVDQVNH